MDSNLCQTATCANCEVHMASIEFLIKNPGRPGDDQGHKLRLPAEGSTVRDVKLKLQGTYPGHPHPDTITIIYAGRVLKQDDAALSSFVPPSADPSNTPTLHIVIKPGASSSPGPSPRPAAAPPQTGAPQQTPQPRPAPPPAPRPAPPAASPASTGAQPNAAAQTQPAAASSSQPAPSAQPAPTAGPSAAPGAGPAPLPQYGSVPSWMGSAAAGYGLGTPYAYALPAGATGFALLHPAFAAAYSAALQTLQQHAAGAADASTASAAASAAAAAVLQQPALALMPTLLPIPQPVLPGLAHRLLPQEWQGVAAEGQGAPQLFAAYNIAQPEQARGHQHGGGGGGGGHLRHRRRGALPEVIAQMLREQEREQGQLPPPVRALLRRHDAAAVAARPLRQRLPGFQLRLRVNMRVLLQTAVLLIILYQHCPPRRFFILVGLGLLLYLTATEPVRRLLNRLTGLHQPAAAAQPGDAQPAAAAPPPQQQRQQGQAGGDAPPQAAAQPEAVGGAAAAGALQDGAAAPAAGAGAPPAGGQPPAQQGGQPPVQQGGGLLREVQALVVGFITSLLPGFNFNQEDAAAFEAAQDMMAQEAGPGAP